MPFSVIWEEEHKNENDAKLFENAVKPPSSDDCNIPLKYILTRPEYH